MHRGAKVVLNPFICLSLVPLFDAGTKVDYFYHLFWVRVRVTEVSVCERCLGLDFALWVIRRCLATDGVCTQFIPPCCF